MCDVWVLYPAASAALDRRSSCLYDARYSRYVCVFNFWVSSFFSVFLQNDYNLLFYMMITLAAITKVSQWPRLFSEQTVSLQTVGMRLQKSERENSNFSEFVFV